MIRKAQILAMTGLNKIRYNNYQAKDQLPFVSPSEIHEETGTANDAGWANHSVFDVIALRVMMDLTDYNAAFDSHGEQYKSEFRGLVAGTAAKVASNGMGCVTSAGYSELRLIDPKSDDCWIAWVVYPIDDNGRTCHAGNFFAGSLLGVAAKIAVGDAKYSHVPTETKYSRVVLANVSRAAREVVSKGVELGVKECLALEKQLKEAAGQ